jgi:hypothetical protein
MEPRDDIDDEGAPPQFYHDDENASIHSYDAAASDAILVNRSEASSEEYYAQQEPYYANKYIPPRLKRAWRATVIWVKGPQPPRPWKIKPFFPQIQTAPIQFLNNYFPKKSHKVILLLFFYFCWLLSFALVLHRSSFAADVPGFGPPINIRCTDTFW